MRFTGPAGTKPVPDMVQKLFNIMQSRLAECPKKGEAEYSFYTCPSHLWPEILQNFVPRAKKLGAWIRRGIGVEANLWFHLSKQIGTDIVRYDAQKLGDIRDEAISWILLNRYLKFRHSDRSIIYKCLANTLDSLVEMDLEQISSLPYNGNTDLFDEINDFTNDSKKARLLDGLKRTSRNDFEMDHMLRCLQRWLRRNQNSGESRAIFYAAFEMDLKNIPTEQLLAETVTVPSVEKNQEFARLFGLIWRFDFYDKLWEDKSLIRKSLPPSFSGLNYLLKFLNRLGDEAKETLSCKVAIGHALRDFRDSVSWDKVLSHNDCVMKGLSMIPEEFFEEYVKLKFDERIMLGEMLQKADLLDMPFI